VWEWKTGHLFDSLKGPFPPFESLNPSGSLIAAVDWDESVQVWDAATGESLSIQPQHTDWITSLAWSAEGMKITSAGSDRKVRTWDAATGTLLEITDGQMEAGPVTANSPDSTKTARAGDDGTTITDTAAGQVIAFLPGPANAVSWSPDGARLAVALRNGTIKIWGEG
jgi:WD40 repeat protein